MIGLFIKPKALVEVAGKEAEAVTERWDVPHEVEIDGQVQPVAPDLNDMEPRFVGMRNGRAVAGHLLSEDQIFGAPTPAVPVVIATAPLAALFTVLLGAIAQPLAWLGYACVAASVAAIYAVTNFRTALLAALVTVLAIAGDQMPSAQQLLSGSPVAAAGALAVIAAVVFMVEGRFNMHAARVAVMSVMATALGILCVMRLPGWMHPAAWFLPAALLPAAWTFLQRSKYAAELALFDAEFGVGELIGILTSHIHARLQQAIAVAKDTSPFLLLGKATGYISRTSLDGFAPDGGMPFGLSVLDLATHLIVIGPTGCGKTSCVLRPLVWQIAQACGVSMGLLILDGKGNLPVELSALKGYTLIQPGKCDFNPMQGMTPVDVATAIASIAPGANEAETKDPHWAASAKTLLSHTLVLLQTLVKYGVENVSGTDKEKWQWNLQGLRQLVTICAAPDGDKAIDKIRTALAAKLLEAGDTTTTAGERILLANAVEYFRRELAGLADNTRSSTLSTMSEWIAGVFQDPDIVPWTVCEEGVDIADILHGAKFGVAVPESRYGRAGLIVQALVKQRVYSLIERRGDKWAERGESMVTIVADEAYKLISDAESKTLPIARSLGLRAVFASQNYEQFVVALHGEAAAADLLNHFRSKVVFGGSGSTPMTINWISAALGIVTKPVKQKATAIYDVVGTLTTAAHTALFDPTHPMAGWMRWLRRNGAGQIKGVISSLAADTLTNKATGQSVTRKFTHEVHAHDIELPPTVITGWQPAPLVEPHEMSAQLAGRGRAVAEVVRGGIKRHDIIELTPMDEFPFEDEKKDEKKAMTVA